MSLRVLRIECVGFVRRISLYLRYAPYDVNPNHGSWADPGFVERFVERVFGVIHEYDPNFANSVLHKDVRFTG